MNNIELVDLLLDRIIKLDRRLLEESGKIENQVALKNAYFNKLNESKITIQKMWASILMLKPPGNLIEEVKKHIEEYLE